MKEKKTEPEILENGIKISLGGDYWILFTKSWGSLDTTKFRNAPDATAQKLLIEKVVDWSVPDSNWKPLKFDKNKLLAQIDAFLAYNKKVEELREKEDYVGVTKEVMPECFSVPNQLQIAMSKAFYEAAGASFSLPLVRS